MRALPLQGAKLTISTRETLQCFGKIFDRQFTVAKNLTQQTDANVPPFVHRNRRSPTVSMLELPMTPLRFSHDAKPNDSKARMSSRGLTTGRALTS
jgi:hypothetical protein